MQRLSSRCLLSLLMARPSRRLETPVTVAGAYVTSIKPVVEDAGASDTAGFFIQAGETGPAIFVQAMTCTDEDVCTASHSYNVGDMVTLEATMVADLVGSNSILTYTEVSAEASTLPYAPQNITEAADVITMLDDYASELVSATITIDDDFGFAGIGYESATISTTAITQNEDLRLRAPKSLLDEVPLVAGCTLTVDTGVMWRYFDQAQISVFAASDMSDITCPSPTVVSAVAFSSTEVAVTFDQTIDAGSVLADGSQFTFDNGVAAVAAVVSEDGDTVTVTTSEQPDATLTVTVAETVLSTLGSGVSADANTVTFSGFVVKATLVISELNANISGGCDLIEFYVLSDGNLEGLSVYERTSNIKTFGDVDVVAGDVIVLHLDSGDSNCVDAGATDEMMSITDNAGTTDYATAWDAYSDDGGLTNTDNVIRIENAFGVIQDAVFVTDDATGTAAGGTESAAAIVADAGEWTVESGEAPMSYVDDDFNAHAVVGLKDTGTDAAGASLQRNASTVDTNTKADWYNDASNFGLVNED